MRTPNPRLQTWLCGWDMWTCQAVDYITHGDTVVVLTRYRGRGRGSGVEVDTEGAHVWKLRNGKAIRLEVFADRERALHAAGVAYAAFKPELSEVPPRPGAEVERVRRR